MTRKFFTAVLVVAAFGCARSAATPPPSTAKTTTKTVATSRAPLTAAAKPRELQPVGVAKDMKMDESGVALHGPAKTYLEQVDNSGWSGRSPDIESIAPAAAPPTAVGGGPVAEDANANTTTTPSKDLDTSAPKADDKKVEDEQSEEK